MNLTGKGKFYLLLLALSLVFSYLIVIFNYFPHLGFALSFATFAILAFRHKKVKNKSTRVYFVLTLVFAALLFVRSAPVVTFLNFWATIVFGVLMLTPAKNEDMGFWQHVYKSAVYLVRSVFGDSEYYLEAVGGAKANKNKLIEAAAGILISLVLLAVILPILSTVNPVFENLVSGLWELIKLENLLESIGYELIFLILFRLAFFLGFAFLLPKLLTYANKKLDLALPVKFDLPQIPLIMPKIVVAVTLVVFLATQLQFYLATDSALAQMGISHSQRVNEVFGQLTFVAGLVLVLIYNSKHTKKLDVYLNYLLGVLGVFLTLAAYKSDFDYIGVWGLTSKRLYGLAVATLVLGIFVLLKVDYLKKRKPALFVKHSIMYSAAMLILVNIVNFDYLIAHYGAARTGKGIDYTYLSRLSADSLSYKEQFVRLEEATKKGEKPPDYDNENPLILLYKIESLQSKYEDLSFQTVSLLDLLEYQNIKDLDTTELRAHYEDKNSGT